MEEQEEEVVVEGPGGEGGRGGEDWSVCVHSVGMELIGSTSKAGANVLMVLNTRSGDDIARFS